MTETPVCRRMHGRVAVVAGAGAGLGLAVARRLASEGATVICADADEASGSAAAHEVGGLFVHTDLTDPYMVEALYDQAYETHGSVDVAFHNAGIIAADGPSPGPLGDPGLAAVQLCCRSALPYMRRHGRGSIINTAGIPDADLDPDASPVCYAASRAGVLAISRSLGLRYGREGIRANALALAASSRAEDAAHHPLGRFARPEEIAAAVAFLASDDSSFVTAAELRVDGGMSGGCFSP